MNSAGPYTQLVGPHIYNNARGRARPPEVGRTTLVAAAYASLDIRASHTVTLAKGRAAARALTFGLEAFNLTNRVNYGGFVGTIGSPLYLRECAHAAAATVFGAVQKLIADHTPME
jgi:hypothetical protein